MYYFSDSTCTFFMFDILLLSFSVWYFVAHFHCLIFCCTFSLFDILLHIFIVWYFVARFHCLIFCCSLSVFDILLKYTETKCWKQALSCGVPRRFGYIVEEGSTGWRKPQCASWMCINDVREYVALFSTWCLRAQVMFITNLIESMLFQLCSRTWIYVIKSRGWDSSCSVHH